MKFVSSQPPQYPNITSQDIVPHLSALYEGADRTVDSYYFKGQTKFEDELCEYLGNNHCFVTNSGHASILIALLAAEVKEGDEVVTTSLSWSQTLSPIIHIGAKPIFADIDPTTFQISYDEIVSKVTTRTKAVLVVNLYGSTPELQKIRAFCDERNITMIEDAAQSMGCNYGNKKAGTVAHIGALSFNSGKLLPIGGAGAVTTDSSELFEKIIHYGSKSAHKKKFLKTITPDPLDYTFLCHPILQEIGRSKLSQLDEMNYHRRNNIAFLREELKDIKQIQLQELHDQSDLPLYIFSFRNLAPISQDKLYQLLKHCNIPIFKYNTQTLSEMYSDRFSWSKHQNPTPCTNASLQSDNEVCITSYKWYTERQDYLREYSDALHFCYEQLEKRL